jgi:signal transduction histidine kinase
MSDIASPSEVRPAGVDPEVRSTTVPGVVIDVVLAVFSVTMLVAMVAMPGQETIPYHLMFLAVTLVYGFRVWPMGPTALVIAAATLVTGAIFWVHYREGWIEQAELAEVPLMPLLLLAMVWHARRRAEAQRQVEEMAEERRRSLQREREFLLDTSHAIRTPVAIARGHVELVQGALSDPLAYDDSEVVLRQLDRMHALSTRLLALARLDSDGQLDPGVLELDCFAERVTADWAKAAEREWVFSPLCRDEVAHVRVMADREWLELVVDALVENAVHFTEPGSRIEIACGQADGVGTLRVTDEGPGIAPEDLPHVFERFWHRRPADGVPGSGLGLAMASAAAKAMGGDLTVDSPPGAGARFELSLPLA